ncbi:hypothetical protein Cabys_2872 [Caldithrix abyssi DSM 13497]|uniref:Uncharacterized protein n=1 Tax=Caldithrix abyssi DSM 13497 TaxID=880073 RepID=A0A1J1CB44_CALAY|nr:hypothetical protein Cabys_2872 [Caldithrix abyssi DSM 13497]
MALNFLKNNALITSKKRTVSIAFSLLCCVYCTDRNQANLTK